MLFFWEINVMETELADAYSVLSVMMRWPMRNTTHSNVMIFVFRVPVVVAYSHD